MTHFDLAHLGHTYRIHLRPPRKGNRRLRLSVDARGVIHLSRPLRTPLHEAQAFARAHLDWIAARATAQEIHAQHNPYGEGSVHYLLGERYTLHFDTTQRGLRIENTQIIAPPAAALLAAGFKTLHRQWSEAHLPALVHSQLKHCPWVRHLPPLRYRAMRKTWGSCRADGILTFNTRLIQYPIPLIEHVIIHELCHLAEHNHSPAFYAHMSAAQPDWRARKQALESFARVLPAL